MTLRFKVSLHGGIKGFSREYLVDSSTSLYALHKQMRSDLEFPEDQLILFKAMGPGDAVIGRYGLFDLGDGSVDQVRFADVIAKGLDHFLYFYDVVSKKSVIVTPDGEVPGTKVPPGAVQLAFSKGPVPYEFENGYVAYEDLPEDQKHPVPKKSNPLDAILGALDDEDLDEEFDEDDEEEEDADDEDGKEIYDENE